MGHKCIVAHPLDPKKQEHLVWVVHSFLMFALNAEHMKDASPCRWADKKVVTIGFSSNQNQESPQK